MMEKNNGLCENIDGVNINYVRFGHGSHVLLLMSGTLGKLQLEMKFPSPKSYDITNNLFC